jgi:hypothetical protein
MIIDALNFFVSSIYHDTRTRRMETNDQLFPSANDTLADLPDDIDVLVSLNVVSPNFYSFDDLYVAYADFRKRFPKWQSDTPIQPQAWTDFGNQIRFSAPLLTNVTFDIDYTRKPTPALLTEADPTDTIELSTDYKELATLGALKRCMESNEDYAEASSEMANLAPLITSWIRNEARGGIKTGPRVMRTGRIPGGYDQRHRSW